MKIDVEGAEFGVLKGALKTLETSRPVVLFECANNAAPYYGYDLAALASWLDERGYVTSAVNGQQIDRVWADLLFHSRLCCDFIACPRERAQEVAAQIEKQAQSI
jgi:hypothetical protein